MTIFLGGTAEEFAQFVSVGGDDHHHVVAVAWVIDTAAERLLLLRHRTHGWSCPGGHVEPGETAVDAAVRELREETGIAATPLSEDPAAVVRSSGCPRMSHDANTTHWALGYMFGVPHTVPARFEPGQPGAWFALDSLPHFRPSDIDVVLNELGLR